jgi:hypothetical protein
LTKGRKTVDQLSATWGASFGAVAGVLAYLAVVLLVTQPDLSNGYFLVQALLEAALSSLVGAGLGAGTLLAAKRTTERLDSGATPPEKRLA